MTRGPRMIRALLLAVGASSLIVWLAGPASAALPNGHFSGVTLSPATPNAATSAVLTISSPGIERISGSLEVRFMLGFTSSAKSVQTLCAATQAAAAQCPAGSLVGTGSVTVGSSLGARAAVPLTVALGAPAQPGDIATVYLYSDAGGHLASAAARLFTGTNAGPELLIADVDQLVVLSPGFSVEGLTLNLHAARTITTTKHAWRLVGKGKQRRRKLVQTSVHTVYSLLTTPSLCAGPWTGEAAMTLNQEAYEEAFVMPCTSAGAGPQ
jgi:hypothetical protein